MHELGLAQTFGLSQNWFGPKSTWSMNVNYNSRPTSKQWSFTRRRSRRKERGKGVNHLVWQWWLASVEDAIRLAVALMESLAIRAAVAHVAEVAATVVGTPVAHGWSCWSGWGESHRPCCYWEGQKWLDEVVVVAVWVAMAEQKSFAEERERGWCDHHVRWHDQRVDVFS